MNEHSHPPITVAVPAGPAPGAPVSTELTAEQRIRLDALDRALGMTVSPVIQFDDSPVDFALTAAARFEAYIRDGAS